MAKGDFLQDAEDVTLLTRQELIWGIPSTYFVVSVGLAVMLSYLLTWWAGPLLGVLLLSGLYQVHENDPQALDAWVIRIRSRINGWRGGEKGRRFVRKID